VHAESLTENTIALTRTSNIDGAENTCVLDCGIEDFSERLERWRAGEHIQRAFSNLPPPQREFIMSGITPEKWDELFKEEDEDDEQQTT